MGEQLKIGENLKNIRKSMGLSLDAVSSMTGVSKTMLSQIERSESVPTLATVSKIANGLKIRFDNLLTSPQSLYCDIKYIENISPVVDNDGKILFYCIFPFTPATGFEIFYCVLKPGCNHVSQTHKNGRTEYVMVADGEVEVAVGDNIYQLKRAASIAFDASAEHKYINNGIEDANMYFVLSYK